MKLVFRTLIILAAALVIVGGMYAFAQSPSAESIRAAGHGGRGGAPPAGFEAQPSAGSTDSSTFGGRPEGFEGRGEHSGHGPSLLGLVEVGKNLAIVGVSVTLIALGARLLQLGRRDAPLRSPPDQPAPL